jgi:hypothetical protein
MEDTMSTELFTLEPHGNEGSDRIQGLRFNGGTRNPRLLQLSLECGEEYVQLTPADVRQFIIELEKFLNG